MRPSGRRRSTVIGGEETPACSIPDEAQPAGSRRDALARWSVGLTKGRRAKELELDLGIPDLRDEQPEQQEGEERDRHHGKPEGLLINPHAVVAVRPGHR
jgi:hypothetical protein